MHVLCCGSCIHGLFHAGVLVWCSDIDGSLSSQRKCAPFLCAMCLQKSFSFETVCLSRFTGVCLSPQLCGCRVCVTVFLCVLQAVPTPLLSPWQCQYQATPRASMPQRRQSESLTPWPLTPFLWQYVQLSFLLLTLHLCFLLFHMLSPCWFINIYAQYSYIMCEWVRDE